MERCVSTLRFLTQSAVLALSHPEALLTLLDGKLACVSAASAAPKLDALATLDVFGLAAAYNFSERMRADAAGLLQALEMRAERQQAGLDLAAQPDALASNFDSLLRVGRLGGWRQEAPAGAVLRRVCAEHAQRKQQAPARQSRTCCPRAQPSA